MRCNRACSFCFAKEKMASYQKLEYPIDINIQNLHQVLDFLSKSGCNAIQLAGGEPTLHPKFKEILIKTLQKGMYINLLSNALWDKPDTELFSKIPPSKLGFLLNIDHPDTYTVNEWKRVEDNLSSLEERKNITISFNIFDEKPRYEYLFDLIKRHGVKNLRLSFAMPVNFSEGKNKYLPIENYKTLAPFILNFHKRAKSMDASVRMDNTIPLCMFSQKALGELLCDGVIEPRRNFTCFPAIDIGPDLRVWRCFGTSGLFNKKLEEFSSLGEIYEYYESAFKPYQTEVFPMDECYKCKYAERGICQGGCIGYSIIKCRDLGNCPQNMVDKDISSIKLHVSRNITLREYDIPEKTLLVFLENGKSVEINPAMKHLFDFFDGKSTVKEVIEAYTQKSEILDKTVDPVDIFATNIIKEEFVCTIKKLLGYGVLSM